MKIKMLHHFNVQYANDYVSSAQAKLQVLFELKSFLKKHIVVVYKIKFPSISMLFFTQIYTQKE